MPLPRWSSPALPLNVLPLDVLPLDVLPLAIILLVGVLSGLTGLPSPTFAESPATAAASRQTGPEISPETSPEPKAPIAVGVMMISAPDPVGGSTMRAALFYPAARPTTETEVGDLRLSAEQGAPPQTGSHPLVVVSHGHAGGILSHRDLAVHLAAHGIIVAAVEHPGDNYRDTSGFGTDRVLLGRPRQISALITTLLEDPRTAPLIDPDRIGVAGFSAGGYTSLLVLGATPDFTRLRGYCQRHPFDRELCGVPFVPPRVPDTPAPGSLSDPRIRAGFIMAPLAVFFGKHDLEGLSAPVFLAYSNADQVLIPEENAARIVPFLKTLDGLDVVSGAGHYVFLPPCRPTLKRQQPELCTDAMGIDRQAIHHRLNAEALAFFTRVLAPPVPPAVPAD